MACIHDQFSKALNKEISSKTIWSYLDLLYDMNALHDNEEISFLNEEKDFDLPAEYDKMKEEKAESSSKMNKSKSLDTSVTLRKNKNKK